MSLSYIQFDVGLILPVGHFTPIPTLCIRRESVSGFLVTYREIVIMDTPFSGLIAKAGATSQNLTTTALQLNAFSQTTGGVGQGSSYTQDGDPAVRSDAANNRLLLNCPGMYLVFLQLSGYGGGFGDMLVQIRKNALTTMTDLTAEVNLASQITQISAAPTGIPSGNVTASETVDTALTVITGLLATDVLLGVQKPTNQNGLFILPADLAQGGVTGAAAATVKYVNTTTSGITPTASDTYVFTVLRNARVSVSLVGIVSLLPADAVALNPGVATFADPPSNVGNYPDFSGAGAAPLSQTQLDVVLSLLAGTGTFVTEYAQLSAMRVR